MKRALVDRSKIGIILIMTLLVSCGNFEETALRYNLNVAKIENLKKSDKVNSQIYLKGKVQSIAPFIEMGAYEIADGTDTIWVFTTNKLPIPGEEITIKGKVNYQSVTPKGMSGDVGDFYVEELERIELDDDETK
ncbi:MAG: hypothetical protein SXA11_18260 [Cyanobacteriota bacterium]|nr:hypothetical protein [Cyanobacteriota bacterium]